MPVVPDPIEHALVAVWIRWHRLTRSGVDIEILERDSQSVTRRKSLNDARGGGDLDVKSKTSPLVRQLSENFYSADEMEEELLDKLLPLRAVGTSEVAAIQGQEFSHTTVSKTEALVNLIGEHRDMRHNRKLPVESSPTAPSRRHGTVVHRYVMHRRDTTTLAP